MAIEHQVKNCLVHFKSIFSSKRILKKAGFHTYIFGKRCFRAFAQSSYSLQVSILNLTKFLYIYIISQNMHISKKLPNSNTIFAMAIFYHHLFPLCSTPQQFQFFNCNSKRGDLNLKLIDT